MENIIQSIVRASVCVIGAWAVLQPQANAQTYTLSHGSSTATYTPTSIGGMTDWNVGGADHLTSQAFWVRAAGDTRETSLAEIHSSSSQTTADSVTSVFSVSGLYSINISYQLTSLSADKAQILESITIRNNSTSDLGLSFFQYNNFDLAHNLSGDYVRILRDSLTGGPTMAQQIELGFGGISEEATVQNNPPSVLAETAYYATIYTKLVDSDVDDLNNMTGTVGPGNVEFAFEWSYTLGAGATETISKIKTLDVTVIPEPSIASLALLGAGMVVARRLRR